MKFKKLFITIGCSLFLGGLFAQTAILSPLIPTTIENSYTIPTVSKGDNTGSDIASVTFPGGIVEDVNVMVYEDNSFKLKLAFQKVNSTAVSSPVPLNLGGSLSFASMEDPDVVAVVSQTPNIAGLKERLLITYIGTQPGSRPHVYLEMYEWNGISNFVLVGGPYDITINPVNLGYWYCATPNIDADYLGNYAVVWEEYGKIHVASENALSTWPAAPTQFVNFSASCNLTQDEQEPDVCLFPDPSGSQSLINVAFRRQNELYLMRMWTSQLNSGVNPFPASHCNNSTYFYKKDWTDVNNPGTQMIHDIRIACPPQVEPLLRGIYDMTIAFWYDPTNNNIVTATHNEATYGLGAIAYNIVTDGVYPTWGLNYINKKPAISYNLSPPFQFIVGWEFTDSWTGSANTYFPTINNFKNLIARPMDDANNYIFTLIELLNRINSSSTTAKSISFSKSQITAPREMSCGFIKDQLPVRYNNPFNTPSFKKERESNIWFVDKTGNATAVYVKEPSTTFRLYPNPINSNAQTINISLSSLEENIELSVLSISGKEVFKKSYSNIVRIVLDNNFESGIYLIKLKTQNKDEIHKFVVN